MSNPNRKPFAEGSLKEIFKILVYPLVAMKPKHWHIQDWLSFSFGTEDRKIQRYRARERFVLRGKLKIDNSSVVTNRSQDHKIRKKAEIWVRTDRLFPNRIDVEVHNGNGSPSKWYLLNRKQFNEALEFLDERPLKGRKRKIYSWENVT